ncbi:PBP1b-binding outer membrane lipoprotein LpoB [Psychrobacter luti]|uniref:PBP1b-binding outer membrane lipoprotein LpoB n=1 Tax=Psychrobacter luti TaxID=198481 RepID=A0A839TCN6_9GAMM|nr:hypothetical protein [Psychrobacter luti]MBB3107117.1 PBP1b-binding outer membrane lipoprotein LpoB [Psychrobacter luti]
MNNFKKLAVIALLTSLFAACSNAPSESTVEGLIEAQYEQANSIMDDAMANAGNDEMAKAMSGMMEGMMPKLERVENINCDSVEGDNTYMCTADITQTIAGNSRTNKTSFKVYQVNDEWVLGN